MTDHPLYTALIQALDDIEEMCPGGTRCSHPATTALQRIVTRHRPVDCAGVLCCSGRWCAGCDVDGRRTCVQVPWPCQDIRLIAKALNVIEDAMLPWRKKRSATGPQEEGAEHD